MHEMEKNGGSCAGERSFMLLDWTVRPGPDRTGPEAEPAGRALTRPGPELPARYRDCGEIYGGAGAAAAAAGGGERGRWAWRQPLSLRGAWRTGPGRRGLEPEGGPDPEPKPTGTRGSRLDGAPVTGSRLLVLRSKQ